MATPKLSVREIQAGDIASIVDYWLSADENYLTGMGVDVNKLPTADGLTDTLHTQIHTPYQEKTAYCMIWEANGEAIGHCNVNPVTYGEEAYMHLHLWNRAVRYKGIGTELVRLTLPHFFQQLQLKRIYCQPYALNPAPNKALQKAGFTFLKEYITIPGALNFQQPVQLWQINCDEIFS